MEITRNLRSYLIGDRTFYKKVLFIVVPIIIQNTITNVVNLLDNIMIGCVGTLEMSSVAIINQLIFIFNLCIFGALWGAGIFSTQYAGAKDVEGVRNCFRIKVIISTVILVGTIVIFGVFSKSLISLYIADGTSMADIMKILGFATSYLKIMLIGIIPYTFTQIYSGSLREIGETKIAMYGSVSAIFINIIFNYLLIFGKCGFPRLGVTGAALATVFSRFVEFAVIVVLTHINSNKFEFIKGAYRSFKLPVKLCKDIAIKGVPILINEFFWSLGVASYMQCYSVRGINVVAATNIASTVTNLFNVVFVSLSTAVAIMVGQCLGANQIREAKQTVWRLSVFSFIICGGIAVILTLLSGLIPQIYNTQDEVKQLATNFLRITALMMPIVSFNHSSYSTLRSGGKTIITFLFDSGFMWALCVPTAFILSNFTLLNITYVYFIVNGLEFVKFLIAFTLVKKGVWISNIVK